ncbi:Opy2 domain-containing protein [Mycena chlorophos]|uniref:Opy2 domain-containing protein n=1 Tax=Mycena chlorophos TaxID=658473 RepID=A0A8H6SEF1_MYCCL|nr:Opy2 domain-containing protein [Mycena chlorophos]
MRLSATLLLTLSALLSAGVLAHGPDARAHALVPRQSEPTGCVLCPVEPPSCNCGANEQCVLVDRSCQRCSSATCVASGTNSTSTESAPGSSTPASSPTSSSGSASSSTGTSAGSSHTSSVSNATTSGDAAGSSATGAASTTIPGFGLIMAMLVAAVVVPALAA